jgi:hypothetical protein
MNDLLNTRLFSLLSEPSQEVTNEEMQNAYGDFVEHVKAVSDSGNNTTALRTLNVTRIELAALEPFHRYEQGENALKLTYLHKTIWYLESEIDLIKLTFQFFPTKFITKYPVPSTESVFCP